MPKNKKSMRVFTFSTTRNAKFTGNNPNQGLRHFSKQKR